MVGVYSAYDVCVGNNAEAAGIMLVMYLMEFSPPRGRGRGWGRYWVGLVGLMTVLVYTRLTTAIFLLPLALRHLLSHPHPGPGIILALPPALIAAAACVLCDAVGYHMLDRRLTLTQLGSLLLHPPAGWWGQFVRDITVSLSDTVTPYNFYYYNVRLGYANVFGVRPLHWYLSEVRGRVG